MSSAATQLLFTGYARDDRTGQYDSFPVALPFSDGEPLSAVGPVVLVAVLHGWQRTISDQHECGVRMIQDGLSLIRGGYQVIALSSGVEAGDICGPADWLETDQTPVTDISPAWRISSSARSAA